MSRECTCNLLPLKIAERIVDTFLAPYFCEASKGMVDNNKAQLQQSVSQLLPTVNLPETRAAWGSMVILASTHPSHEENERDRDSFHTAEKTSCSFAHTQSSVWGSR